MKRLTVVCNYKQIEEVMSLLTQERHRLILELVNEKSIVKVQELVEQTNTSESTIRRDLQLLEEQNLIKRIHGGASLPQGNRNELGIPEKSTKNLQEKMSIAEYSASLVNQGECIYLDAGTTTFQMIEFLKGKDIVVVTNGLTHIDLLLEHNINTYLVGGYIKSKTRALIGSGALASLKQYSFDKCFMGVNGVHYRYGYTTPDPEEALIKQTAIQLSRQSYFLADTSKFGEVAFSKIVDLDKAQLITTESNVEVLAPYESKTTIKVVVT
ncbi:DeoR family fructose operon transcriptional repressor [Bacillus luteolus]|nr:DeoR family fructose operon transcriptional repressor [Cytobacillus luteolus]